jgi:hypothetical protein
VKEDEISVGGNENGAQRKFYEKSIDFFFLFLKCSD